MRSLHLRHASAQHSSNSIIPATSLSPAAHALKHSGTKIALILLTLATCAAVLIFSANSAATKQATMLSNPSTKPASTNNLSVGAKPLETTRPSSGPTTTTQVGSTANSSSVTTTVSVNNQAASTPVNETTTTVNSSPDGNSLSVTSTNNSSGSSFGYSSLNSFNSNLSNTNDFTNQSSFAVGGY